MEIECNCGERRFEVPPKENVHCPRCGRAYTGVSNPSEFAVEGLVPDVPSKESLAAKGLGFDPIKKPKKKSRRRKKMVGSSK
jgi:hypothetical protein